MVLDFGCFPPSGVKLFMLEFMRQKKTQWRGINWGQLLCRENQEFICLDLPGSHILINIRGVIIASVYNDNSFSWFWLIGWGKEINSFILFYSISRTLCVTAKLVRWLICSSHLMAYGNKCIYHTIRTQTDMPCNTLI